MSMRDAFIFCGLVSFVLVFGSLALAHVLWRRQKPTMHIVYDDGRVATEAETVVLLRRRNTAVIWDCISHDWAVIQRSKIVDHVATEAEANEIVQQLGAT